MSSRTADTELRRRLVSRDGRALAAAYDVHAGAVYSIARRVTANRSRAEHITQDVFVALWESPQRFDPTSTSLRTYLAVLAHRRAIDMVRSQVAHERPQRRLADIGPDEAPVERGPTAPLASDQSIGSLRRLPQEQRECIELAYFIGLTPRQVASHLQIAESTAKSRIRLGLEHLQRMSTEATGTAARAGGVQP